MPMLQKDPNYAVEIDWDNPLTTGLSVAYFNGKDLVSDIFITDSPYKDSGVRDWAVGGVARINPDIKTLTEIGVVIGGRTNDLSSSGVIAGYNNSAGNNKYSLFTLNVNRRQGANYIQPGGFEAQFLPDRNSYQLPASFGWGYTTQDAPFKDMEPHVLAFNITPNTVNRVYRVDGGVWAGVQPVWGSGNPVSNANFNDENFAIGGFANSIGELAKPSNPNLWDGKVLLIYNRALSAAEQEALTANPDQILKPIRFKNVSSYTLPAITGEHDFVMQLKKWDFKPEAIDGGPSSIKNGGGDLRVYEDILGYKELPVHVVTFVTDPVNPQIDVRVRVPNAVAGKKLYIFGGDAATVARGVTEPFGRNAVFSEARHVIDLAGDIATDVAGLVNVATFGSPSYENLPNGMRAVNIEDETKYLVLDFQDINTVDLHISAWVKLNVSNAYATIASIRKGSQWQWQYRFENTKPSLLIGGSSPEAPNSTDIDVWYRHDVVVSGSTIKYYKNGVLIHTTSFTGSITQSNDFSIVIGNTHDLTPTTSLKGALANVVIGESAVPDELVALEYDNQSTVGTSWGTVGAFEAIGEIPDTDLPILNAIESELPNSLTLSKSKEVISTSESETAAATGLTKSKAITSVAVAEIASVVSLVKTAGIGQSTNTETAEIVDGEKSLNVSSTGSVESAYALVASGDYQTGQAASTESSLQVILSKSYKIGLSQVTEAATDVSRTIEIGGLTGIEAATPVSAEKVRAISPAYSLETSTGVTSGADEMVIASSYEESTPVALDKTLLIQKAEYASEATQVTKTKYSDIVAPIESDQVSLVSSHKFKTLNHVENIEMALNVTPKGKLGHEISSNGTGGNPSIIYPFISLPSDNDNRFYAEIMGAKPDDLIFNEDGTFIWPNLGVGAHAFDFRIYKNGILFEERLTNVSYVEEIPS